MSSDATYADPCWARKWHTHQILCFLSLHGSRFWCRMSDSLTFSHVGGKSPSTPRESLHTWEPCGTSCRQMAELQTKEGSAVCFTRQESTNFSLRTAGVNRRHSADGTISSRSGSTPRGGSVGRYHPYHRQCSDGEAPGPGGLQQGMSSFSCLQELCSPGTCSSSSRCEASSSPSWDQYNGSIQSSFPELLTVRVDPSCFLPQSCPSYSSSSPLQQVSPRLYSNSDQSNSSKYSLQSVSTQSHLESTAQSLFPKPIYSYSILIFLALKNSKTGSLPVSEIYSFMSEHFPYFKSAPDGWKNSVRHNLSLNKCFEKVENKNGNSSRKGCLWALNPAKVEKMQEELHKWRRKDPISVRSSMARPEDLDRLLGERPNKLRPLPSYTNPSLLSRVAPVYGTTSTSCTPAQLRPPFRRPHVQPHQPCYLQPGAAHPSNSFAVYSPCGHQHAAGVPSATEGLHSPVAGKMPPSYGGALQSGYSSRSMQEMLLEGDASYDIDTLNPSLTDLQLQGNLWEELQQDSLVSDPQVTAVTPPTTSTLQDVHTGCLVTSACGQTSEVTDVAQRKAEDEEENARRIFDQQGCLPGLHPAVYSGVESPAGYLTSCTASISLI
uniref:forkhead box protein N1 isoform X2 n=1 Tax=Gasterosteus aculeatus aculeatus TaxID=481459 RepID=UPI001A981844|nr:forkhead box protein N1 isoform X2 [Gasterosteus aculeatus aculeatus]